MLLVDLLLVRGGRTLGEEANTRASSCLPLYIRACFIGSWQVGEHALEDTRRCHTWLEKWRKLRMCASGLAREGRVSGCWFVGPLMGVCTWLPGKANMKMSLFIPPFVHSHNPVGHTLGEFYTILLFGLFPLVWIFFAY